MQNLQLNKLIKLPTDLTITPHGLTSIPYKLASYKITEMDAERITLVKGKKRHTKYTDTVKKLLQIIQSKHSLTN